MDKKTRATIAAMSLMGAATLAPAVVATPAGATDCVAACNPVGLNYTPFVKISDALQKIDLVLHKDNSDTFFKVDYVLLKLLDKYNVGATLG